MLKFKGVDYYTVEDIALKIKAHYHLNNVSAIEKKIKRTIEDDKIKVLRVKKSDIDPKSRNSTIEIILVDMNTTGELIRSDTIRKYAIKQTGTDNISDSEIYLRRKKKLDELKEEYFQIIKEANLEGFVDDAEGLTLAQFLELDKITGRNEYLQPYEVRYLINSYDKNNPSKVQMVTDEHSKGGLIRRDSLNDYERFIIQQYNFHIAEEEKLSERIEKELHNKKIEIMIKMIFEHYGYNINEQLLKEDIINFIRSEGTEGFSALSNIYEIDERESPIDKIETSPSQAAHKSFDRLKNLNTKDYVIKKNKPQKY